MCVQLRHKLIFALQALVQYVLIGSSVLASTKKAKSTNDGRSLTGALSSFFL